MPNNHDYSAVRLIALVLSGEAEPGGRKVCAAWEHGHSSYVYISEETDTARGREVMSRVLHSLLAMIAAILLAAGSIAPCRAAVDGGPELGMMDSIGEVTDVVVGHNNRGPYYLSWMNFDSDGVAVVINGRSLRKGSDYNLDVSKGMISFNSVLATDAIVRVSYHVLPGKSARATGAGSIPVTLNLRSSASGNLRVTGLYAPDDPKNPNAAKSIIGLGGDRTWGAGKYDSMFLVSQRNDDKSDGALWDRSAAKFGGNTSIGKFKFSGSFLHSGQEFEGGKEYKTGVGKEAMSFSTAFAASKTVQASASYASSEDTAGEHKGARNVTNEQRLTFTPQKSTNLSFLHSTSELRSAAGAEDTVDSRGVQLSSTVIPRLALRSSFTQRMSESAGAEQSVTAGVTAKPIDSMSVDVDYGTLENNTVGNQVSTGVKVSTKPIEQLAVQAVYTGVDSTKLGETTKTSVAIQAAPVKNVQLKGSVTNSADPVNESFQRDLAVSSTPARFARLSAMFSQKGINDTDDVTKGAELQLLPSKRATLSAACRYAESGPQVLTIYDYSATTKPWDFLNLAGNYRQRDLRDADALDSADVRMSLAPARIFSLTGEYQANPEDKNGQVQVFDSQSVGLTTRIGSVGLETNYFQKNEYDDNRLSDERKVGLAVPLFGHGRLTTGYTLGRVLDGSEAASRSYSLGYSHSVGSDFSLSLTGYYTQYLQDKMLQPDKTEVSAEASLGARF